MRTNINYKAEMFTNTINNSPENLPIKRMDYSFIPLIMHYGKHYITGQILITPFFIY